MSYSNVCTCPNLSPSNRAVDCVDPPAWYDELYHHEFVDGEAVISLKGRKRPLAREAIAHPIAACDEVFVRPGLGLVITVFETWDPKYQRRAAYPILTEVVHDPLYEDARFERAAGFKGLHAFRLVMADIGVNLVTTDAQTRAYLDMLLEVEPKLVSGWPLR